MYRERELGYLAALVDMFGKIEHHSGWGSDSLRLSLSFPIRSEADIKLMHWVEHQFMGRADIKGQREIVVWDIRSWAAEALLKSLQPYLYQRFGDAYKALQEWQDARNTEQARAKVASGRNG